MRHAAKVISGKNWNEILVLRQEIKMDSHPGWHALLGLVHKISDCDQDDLVVFSVIILFFIFCVIPVFFLQCPESWVLSLLAISLVNTSFTRRLFYGRPYLISSSLLLILFCLWPKLRSRKFPYQITLLLTLLIALSTWIHGTWYLFALPIICFWLAGRRLVAVRLSLATIIGILLGAIFTGEPYLFLKQSLIHLSLALGNNIEQYMLVSEFQSFNGDATTLIVICLFLIWRYLRGRWDVKKITNPVFLMVVIGWMLGFLVKRFWLDWGLPALCLWMAGEFQDFLKNSWKMFSFRRVIVTLISGTLLYLALTNNITYHWTDNLTIDYLKEDDPLQAKLLPESGGIIYSDDMYVFYQTFFKNPQASWRYLLGFEPSWMPPEDLAIFRNIQRNFKRDDSYEAWVKKMHPEDRLILKRPLHRPPNIPGLEWFYTASNIWVGKLPPQSIPSTTLRIDTERRIFTAP